MDTEGKHEKIKKEKKIDKKETKGEDEMAIVFERTEVSFAEFMEENRERLYLKARNNSIKNKNGKNVIAKDDPWINETEWDELYRELKDKK